MTGAPAGMAVEDVRAKTYASLTTSRTPAR